MHQGHSLGSIVNTDKRSEDGIVYREISIYINIYNTNNNANAETGGQISGKKGRNANQGGQIAGKCGQNANQDGEVYSTNCGSSADEANENTTQAQDEEIQTPTL